MRFEIKLEGDDSQYLNISLLDILNKIGDKSDLHWKLLHLEAVGYIEEESILSFEEKVNNSSDGYAISFQDLEVLAKSLDQIIEILLLGDKDLSKLKRYREDIEMKENCQLCIELIDSSYWEISSKNEELARFIIENFSGSKFL